MARENHSKPRSQEGKDRDSLCVSMDVKSIQVGSVVQRGRSKWGRMTTLFSMT